MRLYYLLFLGAVLLDLVILPWFFGLSLMFKAVLAVLPFTFLFMPDKQLKYFFVVALIYFRATTQFNLGILFLALGAFLFFEKYFLTNFFHKTAWQTLALASGGISVFYFVLLGFSRVLTPDIFYINSGLLISILFSMVVSTAFNFLINKIYKHN